MSGRLFASYHRRLFLGGDVASVLFDVDARFPAKRAPHRCHDQRNIHHCGQCLQYIDSSVGFRGDWSCRLLHQFVEQTGADTGTVSRFFRDGEDYRKNIRSIMDYRLQQIDAVDLTLRRCIERSIEDIPESPTVCLSAMRGRD